MLLVEHAGIRLMKLLRELRGNVNQCARAATAQCAS
jgi:hypothetical protein